jgi:hypothetical protein
VELPHTAIPTMQKARCTGCVIENNRSASALLQRRGSSAAWVSIIYLSWKYCNQKEMRFIKCAFWGVKNSTFDEPCPYGMFPGSPRCLFTGKWIRTLLKR